MAITEEEEIKVREHIQSVADGMFNTFVVPYLRHAQPPDVQEKIIKGGWGVMNVLRAHKVETIDQTAALLGLILLFGLWRTGFWSTPQLDEMFEQMKEALGGDDPSPESSTMP